MELREKLILEIANGTANKNGVNTDVMFSKVQAEGIVKLADAIIKAMEPEKKEK